MKESKGQSGRSSRQSRLNAAHQNSDLSFSLLEITYQDLPELPLGLPASEPVSMSESDHNRLFTINEGSSSTSSEDSERLCQLLDISEITRHMCYPTKPSSPLLNKLQSPLALRPPPGTLSMHPQQLFLSGIAGRNN
jgi:hypothetical protein